MTGVVQAILTEHDGAATHGPVSAITIAAILFAFAATIGIGALSMRLARTTSDFFVASRSVGPLTNASAICGEYLSVASFLGIGGLVMTYGVDMLWFPVGYTAGYVILLVFVAAPLRRFGAYTIADFAEGRLDSATARRFASGLVVLISVAYVVAQLKGAGITFQALTGFPYWSGVCVVGVVVSLNVALGGIRGITFQQAFQYWLKWLMLAIPAIVLSTRFLLARPLPLPAASLRSWLTPGESMAQLRSHPLLSTYAVIVASSFGTMGLPHILIRFYTNPDGRTARRTTRLVLALIAAFYVFPLLLAVVGRLSAPDLLDSGSTDTLFLRLPSRILAGTGGEILAALVACGAFAAFLSTASGLIASVAGAISQDVFNGDRKGFQMGACIAGVLAICAGLTVKHVDINQLVSWTFALAASSFCPLLMLGIWWRRLSFWGAIAGLSVGTGSAGVSILVSLINPPGNTWIRALMFQPAIWTVPLSFVTMVVVSLLTPKSIPRNVTAKMLQLHLPESLGLSTNYRS
jgi:cation/acetate symporter